MNHLDEIKTNELGWNKETRTLSGFASDTVGLVTSNMIQITSSDTGAVRIFELVSESRDRDGDIITFNFEARSDAGLKLVLFND